jgi:hypothetical protein
MPRSLADLHLGFRHAYLDYDRITAQLKAWADAYPGLCQLDSLGTTPEGREIWIATIGTHPERPRPAAWVDGNMHAVELAGSSVALAIAEDVLQLHTGGKVDYLTQPIVDRVKDVLFYVVPRISPDGAETVLSSGRYVRSVPRDERVDRGRPRWLLGDVDDDGKVMMMRVRDAGGEMIESHEFPGLMVERTIDDAGPFWKLYPEGTIEHYDGKTIPSPFFLSDNPIDLNRNFPWSWTPGHEQIGAGPFAASEPEARAIVEFATRHPEIFAWLNLHTFGGVAIRPLGHGPDSKMDQEDLAIYRQLEAWMTEYSGYPTVSGHDEFLYEPDKPLHGDLTDYAYNQRGAIAYVVELWDLFHQLGIPRPPKFVQYYERLTRGDAVRLAWWDKQENGGRVFLPWKPFRHPQLGDVEIGGVDPRFGVWNPPLALLDQVCAQQAAAFLRVAAMAPAVRVGRVDRTNLPGELVRVDVRVENHGYLGTYGLPSAKKLDFNEPVFARCETDGCVLVDPGASHQVLGHLDGWGHGLHTGANLAAYPAGRGSTNAATASYLVRGRGALRLEIGAARVGWIRETISL